jgi:hypothetical protein
MATRPPAPSTNTSTIEDLDRSVDGGGVSAAPAGVGRGSSGVAAPAAKLETSPDGRFERHANVRPFLCSASVFCISC